jgi:hypothetical protein
MQEMIGETAPITTTSDTIGSESPQATTSVVPKADDAGRPREIGGRDGPDPTRYGDWEKNGRCIDF